MQLSKFSFHLIYVVAIYRSQKGDNKELKENIEDMNDHWR